MHFKTCLVKMLVIPCLVWASGFAAPPQTDLHALKREILFLFNQVFGQEAARVLVFQHLGWELEPNFAVDISCLKELRRMSIITPEWMDTAPIEQACASWRDLLPRAQPWLVKLGWQLSANGKTFCVFDSNGIRRTIHVGFDSFRCVRQWLVAHCRKV